MVARRSLWISPTIGLPHTLYKQLNLSAPTVLEFSAFLNGWAAEVSPVLLKKSKLNSTNEGKQSSHEIVLVLISSWIEDLTSCFET